MYDRAHSYTDLIIDLDAKERQYTPKGELFGSCKLTSKSARKLYMVALELDTTDVLRLIDIAIEMKERKGGK